MEQLTAARTASGRPHLARRLVLAAVGVGLVLRLGFAFGYWTGKPLTLDEQEYLQLGSALANGQGLRYAPADGRRHFERPPGFAVFLAGVLTVSGTAPTGHNGQGVPGSSSDVPPPVKIAQSLLGILGIALLAAVAAQLAGGAAAATVAWLAAVYPPLVWFCGYVLAEPLYSVMALTVVWLLNVAMPGAAPAASRSAGASRERRTIRLSAIVFAAGATAGAAVLTKEAMIFFVPLAALWLIARRRAFAALVFCAGVVLVLTPWVAHNYRVYGRFVLTAPHGGVTFWTGNNPLSPGEGDLAANPEMGRARVAFEERRAGMSAQDLDSAYYQEAFKFIREHPVRWARLVGLKLFYTFAPIGPSYRLHSSLYFGASLASYALVFAAGAAGLWRLVRRRALGNTWALWLLALSTVLMSVVFFPQERFRVPVIDPTLLVCAGAWVATRPSVRRLVPPEGERCRRW